MSKEVFMRFGGSAWDDGAALLAAIRDDEHGRKTSRRILSFESWETFAAVLTKSRVQLLQHLGAGPAESEEQLAKALRRPYRHVHDDVAALEHAGLIERASDQSISVVVDTIQAEIRIDQPLRFANV